MKTMRKMFAAACTAAFVLASCQEESFEGRPDPDNYYASVETFGTDTRTALGEGCSVVWSSEDRIAIFEGNGAGQAYQVLNAYVGKSSGEFAEVEGLVAEGTGASLEGTIAVYPFNEDLSVTSGANGDYIIEGISFPSEQKYIAGSFSDEAFPMTAVCENGSRSLSFKNIGGVLKLSLTGSYSVSQITLTGNSGELLSGPATVTLGPDGIPSVKMSDEASTSVTLICDPVVQLDSEKATNFYISVPPTDFNAGFKIIVTDNENNEYTKTAKVHNIVQRAHILSMPTIGSYDSIREELIKKYYKVTQEDLNGWEQGYTDGNNYIVGSSISDSDSTIFMISSSNKPNSYIYILFDHNNSLIGFGTEENWVSAQEGEENIYLNWFDDNGNICGDYYKIEDNNNREMPVTKAMSTEVLFDYNKLSKITGVIGYAENAANIDNHTVEQEWGLLAKDITSLSVSVILDILKVSAKLNIGLFLGEGWLEGFVSTHYQRNQIAMYNECSSEITEISADGQGNINVFVTVKKANTVPTVLPRNYYPIEEDITNTVCIGIVGREEVHPTSVIYTEPYKSESLLDRTWGDIYYLMYTFPKPTDTRGYVFRSYLKSTRFTNDKGEVNNGYIKYSNNYYFRDLGFINEFNQDSFTESDGKYTFKCTAHASINSLKDVGYWGIYYADAGFLEPALFFPKGYSEPSISSPNGAEFDLDIKVPIENFKEDKITDIKLGIFCYNSSDQITLYGTPQTFTLSIEENDNDLRNQLIDFYYATGGPNWTNNENWCSDKPIEEWYGIQGYYFDDLYRINLTNNNLVGNAALNNQGVININVSGNLLTSLDLSGCTALEDVRCYNNQLTSLNLSGCTALEDVRCYNNQLTSLDLSGCTALTNVDCYNNQLTSLDFSGCTALTNVDCENNQLTSLDLSGCTALEDVRCSNNQLTSLDLSGCTALEDVTCDNNPLRNINLKNCTSLGYFSVHSDETKKITGTLNLSGCTALIRVICENNQLTSLDISGCTALSRVDCENNQLTSLDLSGCTALEDVRCSNNQLTSLDLSGCTALEYVDCYNNQLTSLDLSGCTALEDVRCSNNQLTSLDLSGCTALEYVNCYNNQLTSLDLSGCTALEFVYCYNNQLTSLDFSGCTALTNVDCENNQLTSLDLSGCTALEDVRCSNNQLTSLDLSGCTALEDVTCDNNPLRNINLKNCTSLGYFSVHSDETKKITGTLNLSGCTALIRVICENNQLTSLDISGCTALSRVDCENNQLTSLDLSGCTALEFVYCYNNQLTSLDLSGCTALIRVICENNQLTSLDISGCTALSRVDCENNQLTSLDISGCTALESVFCRNNRISQVITPEFERVLCSWDVRYTDYWHEWFYDKYGNIVGCDFGYTDNKIGWWHPGEPESVHSQYH